MSRLRSVIVAAGLAASTLGLSACEGLKSAMTAHVDVVARAGDQELTVTRFAELLGGSKVPLQKNVAQNVADLWVSYHLLAKGAALNDTLTDPKAIDKVMWAVFAQQRLGRFAQRIDSLTVKVDTTDLEQRYATSERIFAARHILLQFPNGDTTKADSVRRRAEAVRAQVTAANFADMAKRHSQDGSAQQGGDLGIFSSGDMVGQFEAGVRALKPGEVSGLVRSQFGYHIIKRAPFSEVREQFRNTYAARERQHANSLYVAAVEKEADIKVKPNAAAEMKELAVDFDAHRNDRTVLANSSLGTFTLSRVAQWMGGFPNLDQVRGQMQEAPDSLLATFVRRLVINEILLSKADSAKIVLDTAEVNAIRRAFSSLVMNAWAGLNVVPSTLSDSLKTPESREAEAAKRVNDYVARLLSQEAAFVEVPHVLASALREKYEGRVNGAAIDRSLVEAQKIRARADSARPPSAVPMPGAMPPPPDTAKR